ncbi:hypothetical protein QTP88_000686 [Uroleucon formosanum]
MRYGHTIAKKYLAKMRLLLEINSKLVSILNEEKLLMNGIDTSEYSLFLKEEQDSDLDIKNVEDVKFEVESDIDTDN